MSGDELLPLLSATSSVTAGDVLILGIRPDGLTSEAAEQLASDLRRRLPGLADVILVGGFNGHIVADASVLRPALHPPNSKGARTAHDRGALTNQPER